ncbi:MAG: spore maturation protein [Pirellulaceae bacterium]|nr:spore maturation protein [Planctomycetales bacterium]
MQMFFYTMELISAWTIPFVILLIVVWGAIKRVPLYESFVSGAKEGFDVAVMIIPYLVAMLFVINVFRASELFGDIQWAGQWLLTRIGWGDYADTLELLPLALTRPLTGSGSRALLVSTMTEHGPDSFLGLTASLMMGSTETTFYVITVYFGAVQIKKMRHTLPACLIADAAGMAAAIAIGYLLYFGQR